MAASCFVTFGTSLQLSVMPNIKMLNRSSAMGIGGFSSLRKLPLQICAVKTETVKQVSEIVRKQLSLAPEAKVTPDTTFAELGADSLDTVEIVMGLEEAFEITVEEESSDNISTIKDAAELIDKLLEKKGSVSST